MKSIKMGAAIILLAACGQPETITAKRVERISDIPLIPTGAQIDYADLAEPRDVLGCLGDGGFPDFLHHQSLRKPLVRQEGQE